MNIAIILARQNSKGIPLKNLQKVGGISLLGRAILSAQESGIFDKIVVSTDGELIAEEVKKYDDVIIIKRPDDLATDTATSISGVIHALDELAIKNGTCCLLQPTSPLRTAQHIKDAYQLFKNQHLTGTIISACLAEHHPYKSLILEDGQYGAVRLLADLESPRQQLPKAYRPNGAIYFNDIKQLKVNQRFFNEPIALYEMNETMSIDIDTISDLNLANQILETLK